MTIVNLLSGVLLLKLLAHRGFFNLVGILQLKIDLTEEVLFTENELLLGVVVRLLRHLVLELLKLVLVHLVLLLDGILFSMLLIRVLLKQELEHLLLLGELLHQ